jgi:tetratricopeptide (TPR) repeat protein
MKKLIILLLMFVSFWSWAQKSLTHPPSGNNQRSQVTQFIGPVEISILYNSADVHGPNGEDRKGHIWGELVHYGFKDQGFGVKAAPWRAGSNENTVITFSHDVKVEGKDLKAGRYGLFLVAAKEGLWTWIFSSNSTSWGSFSYQESEDVLRVQVNPQDAPYTEWLTYGFDERLATSAVAYLQWENKRIPFRIEANANEIYVGMMRNELRSLPGYDYRNWSAAAQFCAQNKINLEEALQWADHAMTPAIGGVEDFRTLSAKAGVLYALTRYDEAETIMDKAIRIPGAPLLGIHQYGRILLMADKKEKAMEVFQFNAKMHPEDKFAPNVGLARVYAAMRDKTNAIRYWELAIKNIPESRKAELPVYEGELKKLKESN